ncbi:MAG: hypothetical protein A2287_06725 [Candidatus Melainabacteria bacterium RIFOXYA12_FULL_32_12]|nr:MAG: hypothetical protein A2255_09165 [Candidatus Melainabacteria bacterium RIFOXYA2_FULL_32_9]OGI25907.1 MAG: hypothetical protein A2287_06725 [Candidatus Melainabacteria bacterium RIFOXYA12_FULL_32_12]
MQSRSLTFIYRLLLTEISLKKIYFFLLRKLTGLKTIVHSHIFSEFPNTINLLDLHSKDIKTKELNPIYVLIRQKTIECKINFNNIKDSLKINLPGIHEIPPIYTMIRWRHTDLSVITQCRSYLLGLSAKINLILNQDFSLKTEIKVKKIDEDAIELDRRVRTTEEIIELSPYVRKAKKGTLYKIPIIKKPLYKLYFTDDQMNDFKEILAKQAKTRKTNIEIVSIYDKLNIEYYSSIKQDQDRKNLICYLNNKLDIINNKVMYHLVIGRKKDSQEVIKSLALLE